MAVLQRGALNNYLKQPDGAFRLILIFGPDRGLVSERASTILAGLQAMTGTDADDAFSMIRLTAEDLNTDPGRLSSEAYTISLFGGARLVHVKGHGGRNLPQQITPLLAKPSEDAYIVVEAGDLKKGTALRKAVEKSSAAVAIPCYADDAGSLNDLINDEMAKAGLSITRDARQRLLSQLGGDRLASRGEIEKLCLFAANSGEIVEEDVIALSGDGSTLSSDALSDAAALGNLAGLIDALARMDTGVLSPGGAGPQILRHFQMLHKARIMIENGVPVGQVVDRMTPPIFFKRKDAVRKQLSLWSVSKLERALDLLSDAVLKSRQQQHLASAHLGDALVRIAGNATRR
ncbi:MAG: DNA polymerase III subunit delta [Rhizobiales bacterium]|nr:DNA polymerase III subunit delta [Hyphomicrobiales bacterium]